MKKNDKYVKQFCAAAMLAGSLLLTGCSGQTKTETIKLDRNNPVSITVWHYYNGAQESAFSKMVSEFNDTVGKEQGIYVESHSKGNVTELENAVLESSKKEVGSDTMPNLFSSYADTAYDLEKDGVLADLAPYFTDEEQEAYEDSYIEEGRIGRNGELKIFPIAKSTEILMVNKTIWDEFAAETGVTEESLRTAEGITETAARYYDWTDAKTPEVPNDGKAFYGRDAMANLFVIGSMQKGVELFHVVNGEVTLHVDRDVFYQIWQNTYVPFVKGYYGAYGRFRSDDVKIGKLAAYTGSIASASYFPDETEIGDVITPIECMVLPAPLLEGGTPCIIQQGAGMVVTKGTKEQEYASVQFLKWFTEAERNIEFGCTSGYIPVKKDENKKETLDAVIRDKNLEISTKEYDTLLTAFEMVESSTLYTNKAFDGGAAARKVLEYSISDKASADRELVIQLLGEGKTLDEAAAGFITEDKFQVWFEAVKKELESCVASPLGEGAGQ